MKYRLDVTSPGCPESINKVMRMHYLNRHKYNQKWYQTIGFLSLGNRPNIPLEKVKLIIVRNSYRMLDYDNCVSSMKPIVDGLVKSYIIKDDKWPVTGPWLVDQVFSKKGNDFVRIIVEER